MRTRALLGLVAFATLIGLAGWLTPSVAEDKQKAVAIGGKVGNSNSLRDMKGNRRPLHDFKGNKAIVLAFLGTECPVGNLYLPELVTLEKKYRAKGVLFLAVYPNHADDLDHIAAHAYDRDTPFPVVKDSGQRLELTPTEYKLLYHLVRNAGHILQHGTLLSKVWGREYINEVDYIRVYIRRLREKLGDDPADHREEQDGHFAREAIEAEVER